MSSRFAAKLWNYEQHVTDQVKKVVAGKEKPKSAAANVWGQTRKFAQKLIKGKPSESRKQAIHFTKKGMEQYNKRDMLEAENFFRRALEIDSTYARAYLYLGNTIYMHGQSQEAIVMWRKAIEMEPESSAAETARGKLEHLERRQRGDLRVLQERLESRR